MTARNKIAFPFRLLVLLAVICLTQGCSAIRISYKNADTLSHWWIDRYLDLSHEQDTLVQERLARLHAWHRQTQLPAYVSVARQAQRLIAGQPKVAESLAVTTQVIHAAQVMAEHAVPDIADLLLTINPDQIKRMAARLKDKDADFAKDVQLADGETGQRKAQLRRVLERTEEWFGSFSSDQKFALQAIIAKQAIGTQFWYDERMRRQREWLELVRLVQRDKPPRERVVELLADYIARFDMPSNPARLAQAQALRHESAELFTAIHAMATPAQRAHAQHKLGDLISDLGALSREE